MADGDETTESHEKPSSVTSIFIAQEKGRTPVAEVLLTVGAVAQRLGVAKDTLRTWARRYGLGPSEHVPGEHRKYNQDDFTRLMLMRHFALHGSSPADAAATALEADLAFVDVKALERELQESLDGAKLRIVKKQGQVSPEHPAAQIDNVRQLSLAKSSDVPMPADIVDALVNNRSEKIKEALAIGINQDPIEWWEGIISPAMDKLRQRTVLARPGEALEAYFSMLCYQAVRDFIIKHENLSEVARYRFGRHPSQMRQIVLVFSDEKTPQAIATHALAAALVKHSVNVRVVQGPRSSHRDIEVVAMVKPAAVILMTAGQNPELIQLAEMHEMYPELPIFVGDTDKNNSLEIPTSSHISRVRTYAGMVHEVLAVLG